MTFRQFATRVTDVLDVLIDDADEDTNGRKTWASGKAQGLLKARNLIVKTVVQVERDLAETVEPT